MTTILVSGSVTIPSGVAAGSNASSTVSFPALFNPPYVLISYVNSGSNDVGICPEIKNVTSSSVGIGFTNAGTVATTGNIVINYSILY